MPGPSGKNKKNQKKKRRRLVVLASRDRRTETGDAKRKKSRQVRSGRNAQIRIMRDEDLFPTRLKWTSVQRWSSRKILGTKRLQGLRDGNVQSKNLKSTLYSYSGGGQECFLFGSVRSFKHLSSFLVVSSTPASSDPPDASYALLSPGGIAQWPLLP